MKIKYLSGNKINTIVDLDEVKAKSLIEDGLAEVVVEEDAITMSLKSLEGKAQEIVDRVVAEASAKAIDNVAKGVGKISSIKVGPDRELEDPTGGFKSMSHFLVEVKNSGHEGSRPTESIRKWNDTMAKHVKSTTGANEGTNIDGGIAVPVQYATNIFSMYNENIPAFWDDTFQVPMQTNNIKIPVLKNYVRNNTTVANGVVAAVIAEATNVTQSVANWEQLSLTLGKLAVMCPVSDELLDDNNVALGSVVAGQAAYQIRKQTNGGILKGSSVLSNFTGIIGSAATKLYGRAVNGAISFADVLGMYASFAHDDASYETSVWFAHPTVIPQLGNMTSGNYNVYFPPGGAQDGSVGRLMGRPIVVTGWASALGTSGDLVLADLKKYVTGYKGGINQMVSPHVFFLTDETAFRFTLRNTGKPGLSGLITLEDGSTTVSPFVELAQVGGLS